MLKHERCDQCVLTEILQSSPIDISIAEAVVSVAAALIEAVDAIFIVGVDPVSTAVIDITAVDVLVICDNR